MSKASRRNDRRDNAPRGPSPARRVDGFGLSNTFRVARALDEAALAIAAVQPRNLARRDRLTLVDDQPPARVDSSPPPEPKRLVRREDQLRVERLDLETCKDRPGDNAPRKSGGAGGARRFIPWCRD